MPVKIEQTKFRSHGVSCAARVYRPDVASGQVTPCIVMANGFSLTHEDGLPLFAERFAAAGITAITFDFRHLGASGGEPRQLIDPRRQEADFRAAVSFARGLQDVNPDAVAVWGFSLAGGLATYTAADDQRIAAAVALCPMTDIVAFVRSMPTRNSLGMALATLRNVVGRQQVHIPVAGPPGARAQFTQPEALQGFEAIRGNGSLWRNEFLPRSLSTSAARAVRVAHKVSCPLLVVIGENDDVVSREAAERTVERAPLGKRNVYPIDHFGGFLGEDFERVVTDQVEFLSHHLPNMQTPSPRTT